MSVINKMLRDLDSRQGAALPVRTQALHSGIARDTLIISGSSGQGGGRRWGRVIILSASVLAVVGVAAAWWYLNPSRALPRKVEPTAAVVASAPAPGPIAAPAVAASAATPVAAPASAPTPAPVAAAIPQAPPVPKPIPVPTVKERAVLAPPVKPAPAASVAPAAAPVAAAPAVGAPAQRAVPALDALAQAQVLWNAGSRVAATDLLRDALAAVERSSVASNSVVLATLARELARMQLAQAQVREALELLTRLEPVLSDVADIWAMRGNAAQRLGQHADSAAAYQKALKLRPHEARWMLGAAVSLAAQGQLVAAAELAEQARAAGALSPEVAAYLRQSGVILRER